MVAMYLFCVVHRADRRVGAVEDRAASAEAAALILELPPYRLPRLRDVLRMMWQRVARS